MNSSSPHSCEIPAAEVRVGRRRFIQTSSVLGAAFGTLNARAKETPLAPPDKQPADLAVPEPVAKMVGWAVVGIGQLTAGEVIPAYRECKFSQLTGLVSGHRDKALKVARAYEVDQANIYDYKNFDSIADNENIQVVYIALPNSMHAEYTIRALKAGKHVLCEKPMAVNVKEASQMVEAAAEAKRKLMIGYRLHYEPYNRKVMELCAQKTLGAIKTFSSTNCQQVKAPNIRLSSALAGGAVGDVGVYSINAARYVTREEPVEVFAAAQRPSDDPRFREVDESVTFILRFPSGILAHCDCSFGSAESRSYQVHCEKGVIDMEPAFSYRGLRLRIREGDSKKSAQDAEVVLPPVDHFAAEMDHFSECILNDQTPRTPGEEGLADMRIIAAIQESIQSGAAVKIV
ncbi:MAG TPA: Gfo/Idh/MocA family oxidoreductase [Verrucomicrobiales bacterium]|nr:Gfo/Idh/MocA family oxidoreductase [Verrucomicrobiales bacterium]